MPARIIERDSDDGERGTVTEAYTNRELDVDPGDALDGERELLGWLWATNTRTGKVGWVPVDNVRPLAPG